MSDANSQAVYFDGVSAAAWPASCTLGGQALLISTAGSGLKVWPMDDLFLAAPPAGDAAMAIGWNRRSNERLVLRDKAMAERIVAAAPALRKAMAKFRPWRPWQWLAGLAFGAAGAAGLVTAFHFAPDLLVPIVPYDVEAAIGEKVVADMPSMFGRHCQQSQGQTALDTLAARLAEAAQWPHPIKIRVVSSSIDNAMAAPGGHVFIFRGLIANARTPDELAGVMAHELGHVVRRHAMRGIVQELGLTAMLTLVTGGANGDVGASVAAYGSNLLQLSFSRAHEREADAFAVAMLAKAGYRSDGLAGYFQNLAEREKKGSVPGWISTHPPTPERVRALSGRPSGGRQAFTENEWQAIKAMCADVVPRR